MSESCLTEPKPPADHPYPGSDGDSDAETKRGSTTKRPRWVTVFWIAVAIALPLLIVILHLTGILGPGLHGG
jgi:hypothetical protein